MGICACKVCPWLSVPHLWIQDVFWCLILGVFKILCRLKKVSKGVALVVIKEALRKCVEKFLVLVFRCSCSGV